jgi:integrase
LDPSDTLRWKSFNSSCSARVGQRCGDARRDIKQIQGFWCLVLRRDLTKMATERRVPIHQHIIEQGFLDYVEQRRKLGKPLFYEPARSRGAKAGNPHYQKVAERLAEWVHGLGIHGPQPNHGLRHRFKSVARDVPMHPEVANFIVGHCSGSVSERYGSRWVTTAAKAMASYPRYRIAALK